MGTLISRQLIHMTAFTKSCWNSHTNSVFICSCKQTFHNWLQTLLGLMMKTFPLFLSSHKGILEKEIPLALHSFLINQLVLKLESVYRSNSTAVICIQLWA